jgi:hypothetical protein
LHPKRAQIKANAVIAFNYSPRIHYAHLALDCCRHFKNLERKLLMRLES